MNVEKRQVLAGEVTVFLTMLLGLMLVFIYALIESSTVAVSKSYERGTVDLAMQSVFAEYHTVLLEEYHIFALDATYETGDYALENVKERLAFYGVDQMDWEITQLQLLSDSNGAAYEEQILTYMKEKYGIDELEAILGETSSWENSRIEGETLMEEGEAAQVEIAEELEDMGADLDDGEGLLSNLLALKTGNILNLVVVETDYLSTVQIDTSVLPSNRTLETGINSYDLSDQDEFINKFLLDEYILQHFSTASDMLAEGGGEESTLQYEVEYMLAGEDSDQANLTNIVNQLMLLRTGVNYACLIQCPTKVAAVNAVALSIATVSGTLAIEEAIKQVILICWAYAESIMDIRSLLEGNRIELIKTEANWQLDFDSLLSFGTEEEKESGGNIEGGLSYEDYLRILLFLKDKDTVVMRSLDMLEQDLQINKELSYFQVDYCITQLEYMNTSTIIGDYTYEFPVGFTYR